MNRFNLPNDIFSGEIVGVLVVLVIIGILFWPRREH